MSNEEDEEAERSYWYNRWKQGFSWLEVANTLIKAAYNTRDFAIADVNNFNPELTRIPDGWYLYLVYMLLAGYAMENLFKGIIICGMWLDDANSVDVFGDFEKLQFPVKGSTTQTMPIKQHALNRVACC